MRFSTTTTTTTPAMVVTLHQVTPNLSNIKKALNNLVSKLPHHNKVSPTATTIVRNTATHRITVTKKSKIAPSTALKKDDDINRDIRNYYTQQNISRKRQLEDVDLKKVTLERETRHKTVKQYQQQQDNSSHHHWKEHSVVTINQNKSAHQPKWINTHGYLRDARDNSDHLRKMALMGNHGAKNNNKPYLAKRKDEFVWGKPSPLRTSFTLI